MLKVTDAAENQLREYFNDKEIQPIRIYLASGGCAGPRLMLALDDPGEGDSVMENGEFTFVVDTELLEQAKPLTVDMGPMGFTVDSSLELGEGGCGSGGCSSGGCASGGCC